MNRSPLKLAGLLVALLTCNQALAWSHASAWGHSSGGGGSWSHSGAYGSASGGGGSWRASSNRGGTASGGGGSWSGSGYRGGSASGGGGNWHGTGAEGGLAYGGEGSWHAQGAYGASASGYHPATYGTRYYHPPTTVIASSGCYNCGYHNDVSPAAAAAVGMVAGAAIATVANQSAVASASNNAYGAGYSAGMMASAPPTMPMGSTFVSLPSGCGLRTVSGGTFYQCGNSWVRPAYGANGVFYTVVPMP
ncbi:MULTISPECIES: hypothetical protein [unclassified Pseudomonas]|uniref:hypothetical protein n=1 Tax=unclassified Pseudomonas TaxID=196821 RepID=UPI000BE2CFBC|nr:MULTISPECIES: hypothetical protein [unclassified Pseudomonas]